MDRLVRFGNLSRMQQVEVKWVMRESLEFLTHHPFLVVHKQDIVTPGAPVVYVGRPSQWGNPYPLTYYPVVQTSRVDCLRDYTANLLYGTHASLLGQVNYLTGKRLSCWCRHHNQWQAERLCHADILCGLANGVAVL
jgi:hypothetical protein